MSPHSPSAQRTGAPDRQRGPSATACPAPWLSLVVRGCCGRRSGRGQSLLWFLSSSQRVGCKPGEERLVHSAAEGRSQGERDTADRCPSYLCVNLPEKVPGSAGGRQRPHSGHRCAGSNCKVTANEHHKMNQEVITLDFVGVTLD